MYASPLKQRAAWFSDLNHEPHHVTEPCLPSANSGQDDFLPGETGGAESMPVQGLWDPAGDVTGEGDANWMGIWVLIDI